MNIYNNDYSNEIYTIMVTSKQETEIADHDKSP